MIHAFCDGSCPKPNAPGGWAFVVLMDMVGERLNIYGSGRADVATNNTMEMQAGMECLKKIINFQITHRPIIIHSDSQYLVQGVNTWRHNWRDDNFAGISNADLWREMDELMRMKSATGVRFKWVKGHNGNYWNEWCDKAAGRARTG